MLLLAIVLIFDGLCGPQLSPMNLAGVLPWIHWRYGTEAALAIMIVSTAVLLIALKRFKWL